MLKPSIISSPRFSRVELPTGRAATIEAVSPSKRLKKMLKAVLPPRTISAWAFMRGMRVKKVSYSQYGEDLIVGNYFDRKGIAAGVYVDIGAFHPVWVSNTHLFHMKGWTGHVYDIDAAKIRGFKIVRGGRVDAHCAAVTPEPVNGGHVNVYKVDRPWSELDTLSLEEAQAIAATGETYRTTSVAAVAINDVLDRIGKVHFLNIDVEGLDESLIMALNLGVQSPDVIVFEDNKHWGGSKSVTDKLRNGGYEHLFTSGGSVGYCRPLAR